MCVDNKLVEWNKKVFHAYKQTIASSESNTYVQFLNNLSFFIDLELSLEYERVHHVFMLPKLPVHNCLNNRIKYPSYETFFSQRKKQKCEYFIRTAGVDFNLLTKSIYTSIVNDNKNGCYSIGKDFKDDDSILILAHLFSENNYITEIQHNWRKCQIKECNMYGRKVINISLSIKINDCISD